MILLRDLLSRLVSTRSENKIMKHRNQNFLWRALQESKYSSSQQRLNLFTLSATTNKCNVGKGLRRIEDVILPNCRQQHADDRKIPKLFHQTSRSRCLTPLFYNLSSRWQESLTQDYCFFFHDENAFMKLLKKDWKEFKLLRQVFKCAEEATAAVAADLWRYLILWEYGGIYADLDSAPNSNFHPSVLDGHQAFFVVDKHDMMSEYFIAVSPKHPIIYYTLHHALQNILTVRDTGAAFPGRTTGPHSLLAGFRSFRNDVGDTVGLAAERPIKSGIYRGRKNWTVTIMGSPENVNEFVFQQKVTDQEKRKNYATMGMKFYLDDLAPTNRSCLKLTHQGL